MSSNNSSNRPKRSAAGSAVVHTVASGPVLADIYRGITPDGHAYLYYVLSRIWRPQSGVRENYSNRFYERNEGQIIKVAQEASQWIRQNPRAADQPCQRQATGPQPLSERPVTAPGPRPDNGRSAAVEAA